MEKYIVWYKLQLKLYSRKKMYWLQFIGMAIVLLVVSQISFPKQDNLAVGICCDGGKYAKQLTQDLLEKKSIFTFIEYEERDLLVEDVLAGKLECGFLFDKNLDRKIEKGELKRSVAYVGNSLSVKGEAVQETVYAALFKIYSDELLKHTEKEIYGNKNQERMQKLIEKNHEYQRSDAIFQLEIENVDLKTEDQEKQESVETNPIKGMIGIFIFFIMFMTYGNRYTEHGKKLENALCTGERFLYICISRLAAGTVPALAGLVILFDNTNGRDMIIEIFSIIVFLIISSIWITIVGEFLKTGSAFAGATISILLVNFMVCPVFINVEMYIPAVRYVRLLFPLGWYLN